MGLLFLFYFVGIRAKQVDEKYREFGRMKKKT